MSVVVIGSMLDVIMYIHFLFLLYCFQTVIYSCSLNGHNCLLHNDCLQCYSLLLSTCVPKNFHDHPKRPDILSTTSPQLPPELPIKPPNTSSNLGKDIIIFFRSVVDAKIDKMYRKSIIRHDRSQSRSL